jgi:hypothetical protein
MLDSKSLKDYKEFKIEKSWEADVNGAPKKDTIIYTAYDKDGDPIDGKGTLKELKHLIDLYVGDKK